MTWVSFVGFWQMRHLGQEDAVYRNYDLLWNVGKSEKPTYLWLALKRLSVLPEPYSQNDVPWAVAEVAQRLVDMGHERPTNQQLILALQAWYNWHRIRAGEVQQFMLKSKSNNLAQA